MDIAGLALGGGFGYLTRLHGLTTDKILQLDIVTAYGEMKTVNSTSHPDLFWALQGAGAGSYGIFTSLTLRGYTWGLP